MSDKLTVEIYADAEAIDNDEPTSFSGVDYVSFVNAGTFGPPALVAPAPKDPAGTKPRATVGQKVLYVNTSVVPLFAIERTSE